MKAWLAQLDPATREKVFILGGILLLVLVFVLVWMPLKAQRQSLAARVAQQRATLAYIQTAAPRLQRAAPAASGGVISAGQSLLALVDDSVRGHHLATALSRVEPAGEAQVRVWLDHAGFDQVAAWLQHLYRNHSVRARELSVDRAGAPGQVNVRVLLEAR